MKVYAGMRITALVFARPEYGVDVSGRVLVRGVVTEIHSVVIDEETGNEDAVIEWRQNNGAFGPWLRPRREGIGWIRGHHNEKSDEIKALLAAAALVNE